MEEGFRLEDWMDLPELLGTDVISPERITNIPKAPVSLTIDIEGGDSSVPEAN